ncbi:MAG: hypothetical protein ACOY94_27335 [Bacillota bacterium]
MTDLSPIGTLEGLEELFLEDLAGVRDLAPIGALRNLRSLSIAGGMEKALRIQSLRWIAALGELRTVELFNLKVADDDITVLAQLPRLERLRLANMWPMEQFAVLAARLGRGLTFPMPVNEIDAPCPRCGGDRVMLIGRGKPLLCRRCDMARIARELDQYEKALRVASLEQKDAGGDE